MVRIVKKSNRNKSSSSPITEGQLRTIAKAVSQMLAVTVAEAPKSIQELLKKFNLSLSTNPSPEELISAVMEKLAEQDTAFNSSLESVITKVLPELKGEDEEFDHFGQQPIPFGSGARLYGSNSGLGGFGSSSSGSKLLDGAKTIGASTASGAAGGGIVGAALGAIGGIFGFANSAKQQKIEKEKASAMTLSSMLQYKAAKIAGNGEGMRTLAKIGIALLVVTGLIITIVLFRRNKKVKQIKTQTA